MKTYANRRLKVVQAIILLTLFVIVLVIANSNDRRAIVNTMILGGAASCVAIPVGLMLAPVCTNQGWLSSLIRIFCVSFAFVPLFAHVSAWDAAIGKLGWLTNASWSVNNVPMGNWLMTVWIHALGAIPQVTIIFWAGLIGTVRIEEEHAELETTPQKVFWHITLPKLVPLIAASTVWICLTCAREISVTDIYRIGTLAEQIYLGYSLGDVDTAVRPWVAMATIFLGFLFLLVAILPWIDKFDLNDGFKMSSYRRRHNTFAQKLAAIAALLAMVLVPSFNLIARSSRMVENNNQRPVVEHSLQNMMQVIVNVPGKFSDEIVWSLLIASAACLLVISFSIVFVWNSFYSKRVKLMLLVLIALSSSLPGPVIGSSILWLRSVLDIQFLQWLIDRTIFAPVLATAIFCFPVCVLLVWFTLMNTGKDILDSATIDGASRSRQLFQFAIAGNCWGLLGVAVVVFAICIGELSASQLAVPPGIDTIPRRMLGMLHSGVNDQTAGLTIVSVLFIITIVAAGQAIVRWNIRNRR